MMMKVESNKPESISGPKADQTLAPEHVARKDRSQEHVSFSANRDEAALSVQAVWLSKAREAFEDTPVIRQPKVEGLRERIKAGQYSISHEKLAEQLVRHLDLQR